MSQPKKMLAVIPATKGSAMEAKPATTNRMPKKIDQPEEDSRTDTKLLMFISPIDVVSSNVALPP
jgi:hypothetical protein